MWNMDVIISKEKTDIQECDVLVIGFFQDERPLKGSSGWIDWRFNGMLSHLLIENKLTGEWKETTLIPSQGRTVPKMVLLFGLGKVSEYSYLRIRQLFPYLLESLKKLNTPQICFSLPYGEEYNVDCGKLIEVLLEGIVDCLNLTPYSFSKEWIESLRLFFAEGEKPFLEILLGVQTAKSLLENYLPIRIFTPSEETFETVPLG